MKSGLPESGSGRDMPQFLKNKDTEGDPMSLEAHLEMLETKHHHLESLIASESARPMPDFSAIQTMKKQKLLLKEELARVGVSEKKYSNSSA
jgi:hypothetical protein